MLLPATGFPRRRITTLVAAATLLCPGLLAQEASEIDEEDVIELTPFEVSSESNGYLATSSLAGTRLRTDLSDIGSSVSVFTEEFMEDVGATDNESLLSYGVNTEVGGANGNFINPNTDGIETQNLFSPNNNTRIRGLTRADNTRNYYLTDVPWDSYTIDRIDIQRGANSILFGVGSPAGIINATTIEAGFYNSGEVKVTVDQFASLRASFDYNSEIVEDTLALRIAYLNDAQQFRQKQAFDDDERLFATAAWMPRALNQRGMVFKIKGNFESGEIESNRPRFVTPIDRISAWYAAPGTSGFQGEYANFADWGLGGRLVDPINENEIQTRNNSSGRFFTPWVGTTFGGVGPKLEYNPGNAGFFRFTENNVNSRGSFYADQDLVDSGATEAIINDGSQTGGEVENHVRGTSTMLINGTNRAAADGGLPFQGFWKDTGMQDTRYFDFYNNLIDGNTKVETRDWDTYEFDISHTFFDNKVGYNFGYFHQSMDTKFESVMGNVFAPYITVNIASLDREATPENRVTNTHAGQAFVMADNQAGTQRDFEREAKRLQAFVSHDFGGEDKGFLGKLLGAHDLVGILTDQELVSNQRDYNLLGMNRDFILGRGDVNENANTPPPGSKLAEYTRPNDAYYPDFHMYLDGSGVTNLSSIGNIALPSGLTPMRGFNATPRPGFSAADAIVNDWQDIYAGDDAIDFQSRNPDNYIGWSDIGAYDVVNSSSSAEALDYLTHAEARNSQRIKSVAGVWTGRFWDGAIVGMYGYREDDSTETWPNHNYVDDGPVFDPDDLIENGDGDGAVYKRSITTETSNWSIKADVTSLLGQNEFPVGVHLLYSEGEVQTPDPSRVDVFGRTLENATGNTEDASIMLITRDGKWSFRATKYKTSVTDAPSNSTVNREKWRLQQTLQQGAFRAGLIETDAQNYTASWLALSPSAAAAGYTNEGDYRREVMAPAWREMERTLWEQVPLARNWYLTEFQPGDRTRPRILFPDGATLVEDQVSEGYEFELTANPTPNWTIAFNASQTEAIRDGIPGEEFGQVIDILSEHLKGAAGELPIWWFAGPGLESWMDPFLGEVVLARALNGGSQPEIREWRTNLVTNYNFTEGGLRGFGVGGAFRYEDGQIYSYQPVLDENGNVGIDLNTYYKDPSRETFDFWVSYRKKLNEKLHWRVQLNIRNAFGSNEVVPLHRNPDGSLGTMGIREGTSWSLTNTFSF